MRPMRPAACLLLCVAPALAAGPEDVGAKGDVTRPVDFNRDVRPILSDKCFTCHGNDAGSRPSDFRLDLEESAYVELDSGGFGIVKGDPDHSVILERVTADTDDWSHMPPAETGKDLTPEEVETLRRWIAEGAAWGDHWSFEPVERPAVPETADPAAGPVDAFLNRRIEEAGLVPNGPAGKTDLLRRVTYTLTGLPPTPEEVDAFLADEAPDAYERVVDRLLDSPRYGEHRARYWLDAARYGDTHGLHLDNKRSIWPYRDWVVRAFNENKPFDEFAVEQLAGDLLDSPTTEQLVATGFNRCNVTTSEGGAIDEEFRVRYAVDRTETVGTVFLGLTVGCAACHDHKFDPVSQEEFYSLYAYYRSAADPAMDGNALLPPPAVRVESPWQAAERAALLAKIEAEDHAFAAYAADLFYPPVPSSFPPLGAGEEPADFVWVDDALPAGAKPQGDQSDGGRDGWRWYTDRAGPVFSGTAAWHRDTRYQGQSFFTKAAPPVTAAEGDTVFAHVYIEPGGNPQALMIQVHTEQTGWNHRAVWGDKNAISHGKAGTPGKFAAGDLPGREAWTRLEVPLADLGVEPGETVDGLAFTQTGGHVRWDAAGFKTGGAASAARLAARAAWEAAVTNALAAGSDLTLPADIVAILTVPPGERTAEATTLLGNYYRTAVHPLVGPRFASHEAEVRGLRAAISRLDASIPSTLVMADAPEVRPAHVLTRGEYDQPAQEVVPDVPAALPPVPADAPRNRLTLAEWLTDPDHPLTARVTVNRVWQQHFGTGLVKTSEDFGSQGEWPSHPELLDWLAAEFVASGWDVKALHRRLVTSEAFKRDAAASPALLSADPENRLLARGPRHRLDAESIRDGALAAAGLLVEHVGGPGVNPYQPGGLWEAVGYTDSNTAKFRRDDGAALYRRSVYTFWKRTSPPPGLSTFDAPTRESCVVRRSRTNTPLQALALMNDVQFVEAARCLAERAMTEAGDDADARLRRAFRLVLGRSPDDRELAVLRGAYEAHEADFAADPAGAVKLLAVGEAPRDRSLDPAGHASLTLVASLLLNTDAAVTK